MAVKFEIVPDETKPGSVLVKRWESDSAPTRFDSGAEARDWIAVQMVEMNAWNLHRSLALLVSAVKRNVGHRNRDLEPAMEQAEELLKLIGGGA